VKLNPAVLTTLLLLSACGGGEEVASRREIPSGMADDGSLLRLPSEGGAAALYRADSLLPIEWQAPTGLPEIQSTLGVDLADQMVYAVGSNGQVIGIDLLARRARPYLTQAGRLNGTADGVVLGLDSARRPIRFANRTLTTFVRLVSRDPADPRRRRRTEAFRRAGGTSGQQLVRRPARHHDRLWGSDGPPKRR
jgi:hypothetical protein